MTIPTTIHSLAHSTRVCTAFLSGVWTDEGGSPVEISVSEGRVSVFGPEWTLRGRGGGRTLTLTSRGCVKKDSVVWEDMHKWVVAPQGVGVCVVGVCAGVCACIVGVCLLALVCVCVCGRVGV